MNYHIPDDDSIDTESREYPPEQRVHETYEAAHWETVHIDGVDNLFVDDHGEDTDSVSPARIGKPSRIRIDLDGFGSGGASTHDRGDNVQASIWLSDEFADQLYTQLKAILEPQDHGADE